MTLVFAGACSHAPGITARAERAETSVREAFYASLEAMRKEMEATRPDALIIVTAEHFANFFMNNMPAYAIGMAPEYEGPIEDPEWLKIDRRKIPGNRDLSEKLIKKVMHSTDVAYCEEWKFDHGIMVPLHFLTPNYDIDIVPININCQGPPLTPLSRAWVFGEALAQACNECDERVALIVAGGISHWPATPNSGKINEAWDREFLERLSQNNKNDLLNYSDTETYLQAGQGGFEIRPFITMAGATKEFKTDILFYEPIPIFAVGCTVAISQLSRG